MRVYTYLIRCLILHYLFNQVMRECLQSNDNPSEIIFAHDDLYDSGSEGIVDKQWS